MVKFYSIILTFILFSSSLFGLDQNKKLAVQVLKSSNSSKLILINKGLQDGVVVNNYGSFFYNNKFLVKGLAQKASSKHSVWALETPLDSHIFNDTGELELILEQKEESNDSITPFMNPTPNRVESIQRNFEAPWSSSPRSEPNPHERKW